MLVAYEVDVFDANLLAAVYRKVDADGVLDDAVFLHLCRYCGIKEALFCVVALDNVGRGFVYVFGELAAAAQVEALLEVFLLAGADAGEGPARHPRTLFDDNFEPGGISLGVEVVYLEGDVFKVALHPEAADYAVHRLSGHGELHSLLQAGELYYLLGAEVGVALYGNVSYVVFAGVIIIDFDRLVLGPQGQERKQEEQKGEYISSCHL